MKKNLSDYTVYLLTHSRPKYLKLLLESIENQSHLAAEVIVVLNGTGQSEQVLDEYRCLFKHPWKFKLRNFHEPQMNLSKAFNFAVGMVQTPWCAGISDDDLIDPHRFEFQIQAAEERGASLCASAADFIDADGLPLPADHPIRRYCEVAVADPNPFNLLFLENRITSSTLLFQTDHLKSVGKMDDNLLLAHDYAHLLRLYREEKFHFDTRKLTKYRVHSNSLYDRHREAGAIEVAHIIQTLEEDPSSILYKLLQRDPLRTVTTLYLSPLYTLKPLARVLWDRGAFSARSQLKPDFILTAEEKEMLEAAKKLNSELTNHISLLKQHLAESQELSNRLAQEIQKLRGSVVVRGVRKIERISLSLFGKN